MKKVYIVFIVVILMILVGCQPKVETKVPIINDEKIIVDNNLYAVGVIEPAIKYQYITKIEKYQEYSFKINKVYVKFGDKVKEGDVIFTLSLKSELDFDYDKYKLELESLNIKKQEINHKILLTNKEIHRLQKDLKNLDLNVPEDKIIKDSLDSEILSMKYLKSSLLLELKNIEILELDKSKQFENVKDINSIHKIEADFDGVVTDIDLDQEIITIISDQKIIKILIDEKDIESVHLNNPVKLEVKSGMNKQVLFNGKVSSKAIEPILYDINSPVKFQVIIEAPQGLPLGYKVIATIEKTNEQIYFDKEEPMTETIENRGESQK